MKKKYDCMEDVNFLQDALEGANNRQNEFEAELVAVRLGRDAAIQNQLVTQNELEFVSTIRQGQAAALDDCFRKLDAARAETRIQYKQFLAEGVKRAKLEQDLRSAADMVEAGRDQCIATEARENEQKNVIFSLQRSRLMWILSAAAAAIVLGIPCFVMALRLWVRV